MSDSGAGALAYKIEVDAYNVNLHGEKSKNNKCL